MALEEGERPPERVDERPSHAPSGGGTRLEEAERAAHVDASGQQRVSAHVRGAARAKPALRQIELDALEAVGVGGEPIGPLRASRMVACAGGAAKRTPPNITAIRALPRIPRWSLGA